MELIVYLSNYVLGNLRTNMLPNVAVNALMEDYDTPSLRILAGLGYNIKEIEEYFKLALKELDILLPNENEAKIILIKYYIQQVLDMEIDSVNGIGKIIYEVLRKTNCFDGKNKRYVYDNIGFSKLYALYFAYDDMITSVAISDKYRKKQIINIKYEIQKESAKFIRDFDRTKI